VTDSLAASCAALARWLPAAEVLTRHPDTDGAAGSGQPGSRPPWNSAAANAVTDPHEGVRRLEASLRLLVTGHAGPRRGGSDANTVAALKAIANLAYGLPVNHDNEVDENGRRLPCQCPHCRAERFIEGWTRPIRQLPAIDEDEAPEKWPIPCPYCHYTMMRVYPRQGRVTCLRLNVCFDADGRHPVGTVEVGRLGPQVRWNDGLVAP